MRRAIGSEISAARVWLVGLALFVVFALLIFLTYQRWVGVWPQASAVVSSALLFAGPLIAAATATSVMRRTRAGFDTVTLAGAVSPLKAEIAAFVGRIPYAMIPLILAYATVVAVNVSRAPSGFVWPSYVVLTSAFALECVAIGYLFGRLDVPSWFPPVAAALLTFSHIAWFDGGSPLQSSLVRVVKSGPPHLQLQWYTTR